MHCAGNRLRTLAVLLPCWLATHVAHAEPVKLEELERRAIQSRASMSAARARVNGAEARIALSKVPYYPQLSAKAGVNLSPGGRLISVYEATHPDDPNPPEYIVGGSRALGDPDAFAPNFRYEGTLALTSRLYDFGRTAASVRAARADRDATFAGVRAERAAIAREVRAAYLAWLGAAGSRAILAENAADATSLRVSVEAHIAEGSRPGAELASARYEEARALLELERGEGELEGAKLLLEQVTGAPLSKTAEPDLSLLERPAPAAPGTSHPEVDALERRRDAATATADAHGSPFAPVIAAGAEAGLRGQAATPFPLYQVGVSLSVPLLDGGLESASAALASSQASELSALAREARAKLATAEARARGSLERAGRRLALAQTLVAAAEQAAKHARDQHELGAGSFEAVVRAKLEAARARLEVLAARLERTRAVLELGAAP
jgi:multidrug efflux system outer membrane protein